MKRALLLLTLPLAIGLAGCSGGADEYSEKAPPAASDAEAVVPPSNKVRMGGEASGSTAPAVTEAPGAAKPMAKPRGL